MSSLLVGGGLRGEVGDLTELKDEVKRALARRETPR
jgi:hypothetical protein